MAGAEPAVPDALHAHVGLLAEPGRGMVPHRRTPGPAPGRRRLCPETERQDPRLRHRLEPPGPPVCVDQDQRSDFQERQAPKYLTHGPLATAARYMVVSCIPPTTMSTFLRESGGRAAGGAGGTGRPSAASRPPSRCHHWWRWRWQWRRRPRCTPRSTPTAPLAGWGSQ
jgi:hypothetical protein